MRSFLLCLALLAGIAVTPFAASAQSTDLPVPFAKPVPSIDRPRKIVVSLSERDPDRISEVIGNIGNIQRFYGADNVRIVLIVYGPGIHTVLKRDSTVAPRIESLIAIGVDVLACNSTLQTLHLGPADLLPHVGTVPNGIPAIVEFQVDGWTYVRP